MAQLTDVTLLTHTRTNAHTHTHEPVATRLLLPRRQINAVRTQCQCNVFVYFSSESLAPPEHPDRLTAPPLPLHHHLLVKHPPSPALSFHN